MDEFNKGPCRLLYCGRVVGLVESRHMFFKVLESNQISGGHRLAFFTIATTVTMEIGQSTVVLVAERMRVRPKLKCVRCKAQGIEIAYSFSCSSVCC